MSQLEKGQRVKLIANPSLKPSTQVPVGSIGRVSSRHSSGYMGDGVYVDWEDESLKQKNNVWWYDSRFESIDEETILPGDRVELVHTNVYADYSGIPLGTKARVSSRVPMNSNFLAIEYEDDSLKKWDGDCYKVRFKKIDDEPVAAISVEDAFKKSFDHGTEMLSGVIQGFRDAILDDIKKELATKYDIHI